MLSIASDLGCALVVECVGYYTSARTALDRSPRKIQRKVRRKKHDPEPINSRDSLVRSSSRQLSHVELRQ